MSRRLYAPGAQWDERRNSSRVFPVPPEAIEAARFSRERYQRERPDWYVWIESGRPELTIEEYEAWRQDSGRGKPIRKKAA